jgi:hypothetical protein
MKMSWLPAFVLCSGCGGATAPATNPVVAPTASSPSVSQPIVPSAGAVNRPANPALYATTSTGSGSASPGQARMVSVFPGFAPDPTLVRGTSQGSSPADDRFPGSGCVGTIDSTPSMLLKVDRAVPGLRILASAAADITMVIELENGQVLCNDDSEGLNPIIAAPIPVGRHRVWVGTYGPPPAGGVPFTIGVTSSPSVTCQSLGGQSSRGPSTPW